MKPVIAVSVGSVTTLEKERLEREGYHVLTHHRGEKPELLDVTLRDYFAAKAMEGLLANAEYGGRMAATIAEYAWEQADAMLAERSKAQ